MDSNSQPLRETNKRVYNLRQLAKKRMDQRDSAPRQSEQSTTISQSKREKPKVANEKTEEQYLKEIYTKIKSVPNFSAKISEFLRQNDVHSKHRRVVKRKFPRRHIIVHFPFQIFMGDLIEYQNLKFSNNRNSFILVLIDVFTKKAYARPLKKKNKFETSIALESILSNLEHQPNTLITDEGLEFYNKNVENVLDRFGIHHYSIKSKMKASVVERLIRTLKSRLEKYFMMNNTKRWIDFLPSLIENYNNTPHRSIGMSPNMVSDDNAENVFKKMFPDIHLVAKPRLKSGDQVRVLKEKTIFEKGYKQSWSDNIYIIAAVKQAAGRIWYKIKDQEGHIFPGIKYYWELNLVKNAS